MSDIRHKIIILALLAVTCFYTKVYYDPVKHFFSSAEFKEKIENFPRQIGDWKYQEDIVMDEGSYKALDPQALIFRRYANSRGDNVVIAIVYHENQRWGAHDVRVCYTSQGWKLRIEKGVNTQQLYLKKLDLTVNKIEVERANFRKTVVYWWFAQGKQHMVERTQQLISNVRSSILNGYCASGLVRISTNGGDESVPILINFVEQLVPIFDPYMP